MIEHGTEKAYAEGCTCEECRAAHAARQAMYNARRMAARVLVDGRLVAPLPPEMHGRPATYRNHGCHCEPCTEAHAVAVQGQRAHRLASRDFIDGRWVARVEPEMHGRYTTYQNYACRCRPCTADNTRHRREYRARQRQEAS